MIYVNFICSHRSVPSIFLTDKWKERVNSKQNIILGKYSDSKIMCDCKII